MFDDLAGGVRMAARRSQSGSGMVADTPGIRPDGEPRRDLLDQPRIASGSLNEKNDP
jgi:hypothetical protein